MDFIILNVIKCWLEIIEPIELRERIKEKVEKMMKIYK